MKKIFTLSLLLLVTIAAHSQMRYLRGTFTAGQVVPSGTSTSTGSGVLIVKYNMATKILQLMGNYRNLAAPITGQHIHTGAVGTNGPEIVPLTSTGGTDGTLTGSQVLTEAQETDLLAGNFYTEIHTSAFPNGEIRAQLNPSTEGKTFFLTARLQGAQVDPPNGSPASGMVYALVDTGSHRFFLTGSYSNLTTAANSAELHEGAPNVSGPGIYSLNYTSSTTGTLNFARALTTAEETRLLTGNIYVDVRNSTYPSGEIRGQLTTLNQLQYFAGALSGAKEVPQNSSTARGTVITRYNTETNLLELTGDYQKLSATINGSHIHGPATPTTNADVLYPINNTGGTMGTLTLSVTITEPQEADLLAGNLYVNVHSTGTYQAGEIRTQLLPTTSGETQYITGRMDASQSAANPAVVSSGTGTTTVLLDKATRNIFVTGSYSNLTSGITDAHIHRGAAGTNGPVAIQLLFDTLTTSGTVTGSAAAISQTLADSIINGFSYLNIHTQNYRAGEIRAQLGNLVLPVKLSYFNAFKDRNLVALIWESAQEINVKNYEVEQLNAETGEWVKKGSIAANGGNSSAKYRFDDIPTISKKEYALYRLKMIDFEGTVTYSSIIRINFNQIKAELTILSNPVVTGRLGFTITGLANNNNQKAEISIIDFNGRLMHKFAASTLLNNFVDVSKLSTGMYKLIVRTNDTVLQQTFSKQ